ncbi:DUF1653 domain-containing protein [Succinivibrio sp.]|uniref:DUF1653 domain-containing protein n=1 Tax=Succinivibrio sp. TaxID=2053619 RepID=UPI0025D3C5B2|nr:DUF1653 domain-containing protein [Succinivibrio sp.]MBQ9221071.1 DUF1653 domain-containing protein [Succinivibrio sp.]
MIRTEPLNGEIFKHFKNNYYHIICVGHHSETEERMVVYERISKDDYLKDGSVIPVMEPCIRPLEMFMSEVDHQKYPDVEQKYRFERI